MSFLVTTPLEEFQDSAHSKVFLGRWCFRDPSPAQWATASILPSPWEDRGRISSVNRDIDRWNERFLGGLTDSLNAVHGTRHSLRYWRLVAGSWSLRFLHVLTDRFLHIRAALDQDPDLVTLLLHEAAFATPSNGAHFISLLQEDLFNQQLFTHVFVGLGHDFPRRLPSVAAKHPSRHGSARRLSRGVVRQIAGLWPVPTTSFHDIYLPRPCIPRLVRKFGLGSFLYERRLDTTGSGAEVDTQLRLRLSAQVAGRIAEGETSSAAAAISAIASVALPHLLPLTLLEGYANTNRAVEQAWRRTPKVLVSSCGWTANEPFKFLAGHAINNGSALIGVQHGGGYGIMRDIVNERYERSVVDQFAVWGWAEGASSGAITNLPSPLVTLRAAVTRRPSGRELLFVANTGSRYVQYIQSVPLGDQWWDYVDDECQFVGALSDELRAQLTFRPHSIDYGYRLRERLSVFPDLRVDTTRPMKDALCESRLVIVDHFSTGFAETLAANIPTIGFWRPDRWEVRSSAEPVVAALRAASIVHTSPESAAAWTAQIAAAPEQWWESPPVQEARERFVERFARCSERWPEDWAALVGREAATRRS